MQNYNLKFKIDLKRKGIKKLFKALLSVILVISWLLTTWPPLWLKPRFPKKIEPVEAQVASGIIVAWPSTNATIPSGWQEVTNLSTKFPKGTAAATEPGTTGGNTTHTHTTQAHLHTIDHGHTNGGTSANASASINGRTTGGTQAMSPTSHNHTVPAWPSATIDSGTANPTTDAQNNDPSNLEVIFIKSTTSHTGIPNGAMAFFNNASLPASWTQYTNAKNRFLKGVTTGGDGGTTNAGNAAHTHTASHTHTSAHTHAAATSGVASGTSVPRRTGSAGSQHQHTHSVSGSSGNFGTSNSENLTTVAGTVEPPWYKLAIIQNGTGVNDIPVGTIAMWDGTLASIPEGWALCDGTNSTPDLRNQFIKGVDSTSEIGNSGGALGHSHTANSHTHTWASTAHTHATSWADAANYGEQNGSANAYSASAHGANHAGTSSSDTIASIGNATPTVDNTSDTQPSFYTVAYIQYKGSTTFTQNRYRWYVDNDSTNPTDPWSSITDINIAENAGVTILPAKYDPPSTSQELRLRVNLTVGTSNLVVSSKYFKLQYKAGTDASCTSGSWTDVLSGNAWEYASSSVTDGADITLVLSDTTSAKGEEYVKSRPSQLNHVAASVGEKVEYDFHIVGTNSADSTQYSFRVVETNAGGTSETVLTSYSSCPTLVTEPSVSRLMRHGEFLIETATGSGFFWAD